MRTVLVALLAALATTASPVPPRLRSKPEPLPVARLVANLEAALKQAPDNHELHYGLGRVHYLAFANQASILPHRRETGGIARVADKQDVQRYFHSLRQDEAMRRARTDLGIDDNTKFDSETHQRLGAAVRAWLARLDDSEWRPVIDARKLRQHAELALAHFDEAIAMQPGIAIYQLSRACLLEQALDFEQQGKLTRLSSWRGYRDLDYATVRDRYRDAYRVAREIRQSKGKWGPLDFPHGVEFEAGTAYLRLVDGDEELRAGQDNWIETTRAAIARLEPESRALTPIVFGDRPQQRLRDLLDPDSTALFDLDGSGVPERWGWVRRDAHLLAWDPHGDGDIRSGRQLLGSVTWDLFHRDGYAALRLLDSDGDDRLSLWELQGLAAWTDHDGDGSSTAEELQPLWQLGVTELGLVAERDQHGVLHAAAGLRFADGRVLPTFDWETVRRQR